MQQTPHHPDQEDTAGKSKFSRVRLTWARNRGLSPRDFWWDLLDLWEESRAVRGVVITAFLVTVLGLVFVFIANPWWQRRNALSIAQQWLEAGKLTYASQTIRQAIEADPENPEAWQLSADIARRAGEPYRAFASSREAARLDPESTDRVLTWASDALLADQPSYATQALATLPSEVRNQSAWAQRLAGEIARRTNRYDEARLNFTRAVALEGRLAVNEVPLGIVTLTAGDRDAGIKLLDRWAADPDWGATALRVLLDDALRQDDRAAMRHWADALRAHPLCTAGDLPNCLLALSRSDEARFRQVLAEMEPQHATDVVNAAQLLGWLNQIGRSAEALAWSRTLPETITRTPPAIAMLAESLRVIENWSELQTWTRDGDWGPNMEIVRIAYRLLAAKKEHNPALAADIWQTLQARASENGARTLFAADNMYAWGLQDEAVALLWKSAEQAGSSLQALATLARHYQVNRDAEGQYRVFRRLHALRANDPQIANNFAFFAALTGNAQIEAETIAQKNLSGAPANIIFRATYSFVLLIQQKPAHAMEMIRPLAKDWESSPAIAFAYGLALAGNDDKIKAREVLSSLDPSTLTEAEVRLILASLK